MVFGRSVLLWPADLDRRPASTTSGTAAGHAYPPLPLIQCVRSPLRHRAVRPAPQKGIRGGIRSSVHRGRYRQRRSRPPCRPVRVGPTGSPPPEQQPFIWTTTPWCCRPRPHKQAPRRHRLLPTHGGRRGSMYAAGRIPGSFFRREGRLFEGAILTCRLIDRPLRPCFVKGLRNRSRWSSPSWR